MTRRTWNWLGGAAVLLPACILSNGCTSALSLFNPDFLAATGVAGRAASLPGEAPAVLAIIENRTTLWVEAQISWRSEGDQVDTKTFVVPPGDRLGEVLTCPVEEITLGDISNLDEVGALVRLGSGEADDPFIEVEAFGVLLKEGANYDCGDSVTFAILPSGATRSGYQVYAFIQRAEAP